MSTTAQLETEHDLRLAAEKNYRDLVAFLSGETPETYSLHVKCAAEKLREQIDTTTIIQRDAAEEAADKLASVILGEPIDWPDHAAKWDEALEEVSIEHARIEEIAAKMKKFVAENYPPDANGQVDFVRLLVEGYAAELLGQET